MTAGDVCVYSTQSSLKKALRWRHNDHAGVSNHQPHGCLLNRLFRRKSKKTSKLRVTGLCAGNSPGTGEFPAQMASYAENVSIWWRHHGQSQLDYVVHTACCWCLPYKHPVILLFTRVNMCPELCSYFFRKTERRENVRIYFIRGIVINFIVGNLYHSLAAVYMHTTAVFSSMMWYVIHL